MSDSDQFLSEVMPLPDGHHGKPDLVLGIGNRRKLFHVPSFRGGYLLAIDTIYGDGRLFVDELGMVIEVGFSGSVFGVAEVAGGHELEMELGAAAVGRGVVDVAGFAKLIGAALDSTMSMAVRSFCSFISSS